MSVRLLDGPAQGKYNLRRAPIWLRAVVDASGHRDVLDQLHDEPLPAERVHVYLATGPTFGLRPDIIVCPPPGASGEYRLLPDVDGEALRETTAWREWVTAQPLPDWAR